MRNTAGFVMYWLDSVNIWGLTPEGDRFRLNLRVRSSYPNQVGEAYSCLPGDETV